MVGGAAVALVTAAAGGAVVGAVPLQDREYTDSYQLAPMDFPGFDFAPAPAGAEPVIRYLVVSASHVQDPATGPASCAVTGAKAICTVPRVPAQHMNFAPITIGVRPLAGVPAGVKGGFTFSITGPDGKASTTQAPVRLTDAPSFTLRGPAQTPAGRLSPGDTVPVRPLVLTNKGNRTARGVIVEMYWSGRAVWLHRYSNCWYSDELMSARCILDQRVEPGVGYRFPGSLGLRLAGNAYSEHVTIDASPADGSVIGPEHPTRGDGCGTDRGRTARLVCRHPCDLGFSPGRRGFPQAGSAPFYLRFLASSRADVHWMCTGAAALPP